MKISWSERSTIAKVQDHTQGLSIFNSIKVDRYDEYVHFYATKIKNLQRYQLLRLNSLIPPFFIWILSSTVNIQHAVPYTFS